MVTYRRFFQTDHTLFLKRRLTPTTKKNVQISNDATPNPLSIKKGNGMKNVEARAAEIKGNIQFLSGEGSGTEVVLTCTL